MKTDESEPMTGKAQKRPQTAAVRPSMDCLSNGQNRSMLGVTTSFCDGQPTSLQHDRCQETMAKKAKSISSQTSHNPSVSPDRTCSHERDKASAHTADGGRACSVAIKANAVPDRAVELFSNGQNAFSPLKSSRIQDPCAQECRPTQGALNNPSRDGDAPLSHASSLIKKSPQVEELGLRPVYSNHHVQGENTHKAPGPGGMWNAQQGLGPPSSFSQVYYPPQAAFVRAGAHSDSLNSGTMSAMSAIPDQSRLGFGTPTPPGNFVHLARRFMSSTQQPPAATPSNPFEQLLALATISSAASDPNNRFFGPAGPENLHFHPSLHPMPTTPQPTSQPSPADGNLHALSYLLASQNRSGSNNQDPRFFGR